MQQSDQLSTWIALFLQPVGVDQPWKWGVRRVQNRLKEGVFVSHGVNCMRQRTSVDFVQNNSLDAADVLDPLNLEKLFADANIPRNHQLGAKFMRFLTSGACLSLLIASAGSLHAAEPSFTNDVLPFLNRCCAECHQGKGKGGVSVDTYESLMKGSKKKRQVVVPGQPDKSLLLLAVEGKSDKKMPPKKAAAQPTAEEIAALRAWIKAGAKDDTPKKSHLDGGVEKYLALPWPNLYFASWRASEICIVSGDFSTPMCRSMFTTCAAVYWPWVQTWSKTSLLYYSVAK